MMEASTKQVPRITKLLHNLNWACKWYKVLNKLFNSDVAFCLHHSDKLNNYMLDYVQIHTSIHKTYCCFLAINFTAHKVNHAVDNSTAQHSFKTIQSLQEWEDQLLDITCSDHLYATIEDESQITSSFLATSISMISTKEMHETI